VGESFAGITVPDGSPDGLRSAAGQFDGLSSLLSGVAGQLQGLPGTMASWQGPASVTYAGSCSTSAGSTTATGQAVATAGQATRDYAQRLEDAQREAKHAIAEARDATARITRAKAAIEQARSDHAAAGQQADRASHALAVSTAHGVPSPGAEADLRAAGHAAEDAAGRERRARHELEHAEHDLHRAQRRGREAEQHAREASRAAAGGFGAGGGVRIGPAGAPGSPFTSPGNSLLYDTLVAPWNLSDPAKRRNRALGLGVGSAKAYSQFRSKYARGGYWAPGGQNSLNGHWERRWNRLWSTAPTATKWAGRAQWLGRGGAGLGFATAGLSQWQKDAANPSLSTGERVGRSGGAAAYDGGASWAGGAAGAWGGMQAGAALGGLAGPVGFAVGGAIGGLVGGIAGSGLATGFADHFTGLKDDAIKLGGDVGNTVSTGLHKAEKFLDDISPF